MTELFEPTSPRDSRLALSASGLLRTFNEAGVIEAGDLQVATRLGALGGESDPAVLLAAALAVRAVRHGSICVDLTTVVDLAPDLPWPSFDAVDVSPLVEQGALRLEFGLLYLDRYHQQERQVFDDLVARAGLPAPVVDAARLDAALDRVFRLGYDEQRAAAAVAARRRTTILTGGPGTGKTTSVAGLLAVLAEQEERLSVALTAPTGKAAARLQESVLSELARMPEADRDRVGRVEALTLHRLLGWRPDNATRFRRNRGNRLEHDLIVVDETSMVGLTMMARLLEALRPETRLVLVGDPQQLASVEAGAVLTDLVAGYRSAVDSPVVRLEQSHRFGPEISALAHALQQGQADDVLAALRAGADEIEFVEVDDAVAVLRPSLVEHALALRDAAEAGEVEAAVALLDQQRLLCAHRDGPHGVRHWNRLVERWLGEATGREIWTTWYAGRPLLVTANDYGLGVHNGETGVTVRDADGALRARIAGSAGLLDFAPSRLRDVDTMHAMTIHKSQGSQAREVTVVMPPPESRLLTRELFYTAITRAEHRLRVVGTEAAVRAAVDRRAQRATGLALRLAGE
jgi:exodeoxyribonuclease V alpha subunit